MILKADNYSFLFFLVVNFKFLGLKLSMQVIFADKCKVDLHVLFAVILNRYGSISLHNRFVSKTAAITHYNEKNHSLF